MKFKLLFSLVLIMSLSLVCAFESQVYHIGVGIPSSDADVIVNPDNPSNPKTTGTPSGRNPRTYSINNLPDSDLTGDSIPLDTTGDEKNNLDSEEKEQDEKGFVSRITGAVIGTVGTTGAIAIPVFVFGIIGAAVFMKFRRK